MGREGEGRGKGRVGICSFGPPPRKILCAPLLILPILLYSAEQWPITVTSMKKLEAAHHRRQRKLLVVTWKDKIKNDKIRTRTEL